MKKLIFSICCLSLLFVLAACGKEEARAPQYQSKVIKLNSIYTNWKKDKESAMKKADSELARFTKSACRDRISAGWSLAAVVSEGEMNCEETQEGHHCRKKNVELKCEEIIEFFP